MLQSLYQQTMQLATTRYAMLALALVAFVESSVFPIPPDVLIIPMVLANRKKAWTVALICTVASVLGGILGYGIGAFLFEQIGQPVLDLYNYSPKFEQFQSTYNEWGAWAVFIAGVTPFPYKVITILSGVSALDPTIFIISSILARATRFFLVAGLLWYFGEPIRAFIEKRLGLLFIVFCLLLVGGFVALKFIV